MTSIFSEIQSQALQLSLQERWQLITVLMRSVQPKPALPTPSTGLATSLVGLAKVDGHTPPTDEEVKDMLNEHLMQKYL